MKKILRILFIVAFILGILIIINPNTVQATTVASGKAGQDIIWTLDDSGTLTISGTGKMRNYEFSNIPWNDYRYGRNSIRNVIIEDGITSIGDNAFSSCQDLTCVTIPDSVTSIGNWAFYASREIENIIIPEGVTTIGRCAFYNCSGLENLTIPNSVSHIGDETFKGCSSLISIDISNNVSVIEYGTFYGCENLTNVIIPNRVTIINCNAFKNCSNLTNVTISNSVTDIKDNAFQNCWELNKIVIPESVTYMSGNVFCGCENIAIYGTYNSYAITYAIRNRINYVVIPKEISSTSINIDLSDETYTGNAIKKKIVIKDGDTKLKGGTDYVAKFTNNVNAGTATITISGRGNYKGSKTFDFNIVKKNVNELDIEMLTSNKVYTGSEIVRSVKIKDGEKSLTKGIDYIVTYKNNINVGIAMVTIEGKGNYTGSKDFNFKIVKPMSSITILMSNKDKVCTGTKVTKTIIVKDGNKQLVEGTDYTVTYKNNVNVGTAIVTITGKGYYTGSETKSFNIVKKDMSSLTVSMAAKDKPYTGVKVTKTIVVKNGKIVLKEGTDYTVTYKNNIKAGTAEITITGIDNYKGTVTKSFIILPNKPINFKELQSTQNNVSLQWTASTSGVTGYRVYMYDNSSNKWILKKETTSTSTKITGLNSGTTYKFKVCGFIKDSNKIYHEGAYSTELEIATK